MGPARGRAVPARGGPGTDAGVRAGDSGPRRGGRERGGSRTRAETRRAGGGGTGGERTTGRVGERDDGVRGWRARSGPGPRGGGRRSRTRGDREGRVAFASRSSRTLSPPPCASVIATEGGGPRDARRCRRGRVRDSSPLWRAPSAGSERRTPEADASRGRGRPARRERRARGRGGDATSGASGGARVAGSDETRRAARNNDERKTPPTAGRVTSVDRSAPSAELRSGRLEPRSIKNDSAGGKLHTCC